MASTHTNGYKICIACNNEYPIENFYRNHRGYYQSECKQCSKAKADAYRKSHPEKRREYLRRYRRKHRNTIKMKARQVLEGMTRRSKDKGFPPPEFTKSEIESILDGGRCTKTGIAFEFDQSKWSKSPWTPVPDRIDSDVGYTKSNTQWVCHMYNSMKQEYPEAVVDEFLAALFARWQEDREHRDDGAADPDVAA